MSALHFDINANFAKGQLPAIYDENATTVVLDTVVAGEGTVTTNSTITLNGTNTRFSLYFKPGDKITVTGESEKTIVSVASDTQLTVDTPFTTSSSLLGYAIGGGAAFPDPAEDGVGPYNCVWWDQKTYPDPNDDPNREIVRILAKDGNELTIARGQEDTYATPKNSFGGIYAISNVLTKLVMDQIRDALTSSGQKHVIQYEQVNLPMKDYLNFKGFLVATDNVNASEVELDAVGLAGDQDFVDALVSNNYFTTELAGDTNFITELSENTNFIDNIITEINQTELIEVVADGVTITGTGTTADPLVAVGGTGGGHVIQEDGVSVPQRANLDFKDKFTITDNSGTDTTEVDLNIANIVNDPTFINSIIAAIGNVGSIVNELPSLGTYQPLVGTIDGVNKIFEVSEGEYDTETLIVAVNGQILQNGVDFIELDPTNGTFELTVAPISGVDVITAIYGTNVIDSKTYINAGTDISISGTGISSDPYIINSTAIGGFGGGSFKVNQKPTTGEYFALIGDIDGVNKQFEVSDGEYESGMLLVFKNGLVQNQELDFVELSPSAGTFEFVTAPLATDIITVAYSLPSSGTLPVLSVTSSDSIIDVDNTDPQNPVLSLDVIDLANDSTFITELTNNATFQTAINSFVSGGVGGEIHIDQTPDNGNYGAITGVVDGTNDTFIVSQGEYLTGKIAVYLNGLIQLEGASHDFIESDPSNGEFKFNTPPDIGDIITVVYTTTAAIVDNYTVKATTDDTTPSFLDDKISLVSTDGSVSITKTLNNPSGNEDIEYDLSVSSTHSLYSVPNYDLVELNYNSVYELQDGTYFTSPSNDYSVSPDKTKVYKMTITYTTGSNYNISIEEYTGNGSGSIGTLANTYTGSGSHTVGNNNYLGAFYVNGTSVFVPLANGTNIPYYTEYTISGTSLVSPTTTNFTYDTIGANNTKSYWFSDGTYYYVWNPDGSGNVKKYTYSAGTFTLIGSSSGVSSLKSTQSIRYAITIYQLLVNYFKIEGGKVVNFTCLKTSASTLSSPVIVSGVLLANNVSAP